MKNMRRFVLSVFVGTLMLCSLMPKGAIAGSGDNYPDQWKNKPLGYTYDDWGHATRYCTSWVSWALHDRNGFDIPFHDNAKNWAARARDAGFTVDTSPAAGAVAWWDHNYGGGLGHVAYIESVSMDRKKVTISEYNYDLKGNYNLREIPSGNPTGYIHFKDKTPVESPVSRTLFVRGDDMLFAKDSLGDAWISQTGSGWVKRGTQLSPIAVGGTQGSTQLWISGCDALYAKDTLGAGGWTEQAPCGTAKQAIVSSTGLQMMLSNCGAVYAKYGIGPGGWWAEQDCGNIVAIAVGGNTQMMLSGCGAVYAKVGLGYGGWTEESPCGTAAAIAVSSTGLQMMLSTCGSFYAKYGVGVGGWWAEGDCGWAKAIAVGGDMHMFLSGCGAVYAKTSMGYGGWIEQAPCHTATSIAAGNRGRQVIITADSAVFAKETIGIGGWHLQAGPGNAKWVAVS